jgi:hypothetical protein
MATFARRRGEPSPSLLFAMTSMTADVPKDARPTSIVPPREDGIDHPIR